MSCVLVIDKQSEKIESELKQIKGFYSWSFQKLEDSLEIIRSEQLDYILCQVSFGREALCEFIQEVEKHQPAHIKVYWLAFKHEKGILESLADHIDGKHLIKPVYKKDLEGIKGGGDLLTPDEIAALFSKA